MKYIVIHQQQVYGNMLYYPQCNISRSLAKLTGKKTLTREALGIIQNELGYELRHMPMEIKVDPNINIIQEIA